MLRVGCWLRPGRRSWLLAAPGAWCVGCLVGSLMAVASRVTRCLYSQRGSPMENIEHMYDCARGRHFNVSAAASRRHVDAFLDLFTRKGPRTWKDLSEKRALSARRLFFVDGGSIN